MDIKTTKHIISSNVTSSIMFHANHGVGKSSCVKQVAKQLGIEFFDIRLSQCDVGDIKGLPYREGETMKFAKPEWWPRNKDSKGILFFDELNRASKDVLQAVFEICLDRTLDGDKLPDGWKIVSAVNSHSDYDVLELDPALQDRWFHIEFSPTAREWLDWASEKINPAIVQFLSQNQNLLDAPVGNLETGRVYPSRRSWEALSHFIKELGLLDENNVGLLVQSTKGWCGEECAIMFQKFVANEYKLLKAEDVLDKFNKVKSQIEKSSEDIEVISSLANAVIKEANSRDAKTLKDKQKEALKQFFLMLPNDVASDFFLGLTEGKKTARLISKLNYDNEVQENLKEVYGM